MTADAETILSCVYRKRNTRMYCSMDTDIAVRLIILYNMYSILKIEAKYFLKNETDLLNAVTITAAGSRS